MVGGPIDVFEAVRRAFGADGHHHRPAGRPRRRAAHQDGQSDPYRQHHGRHGRGAGVRLWVGLDVEQVLASVPSGAAGSWALSNLAPRVVAGNFAPGFFVDHLVKDLGIALAEAKRARLALPGLALANQACTSPFRPRIADTTAPKRSYRRWRRCPASRGRRQRRRAGTEPRLRQSPQLPSSP